MKNKSLIILTSCLVLSVLIVFVLFALSEDKSKIRYEISRIFPSDVIDEEAVLTLQRSSHYIAGATANKIYLGDSYAPLHMIEVSKGLTDTSYIKLHVDDTSLRYNAIYLKIDSPYFYLTEGTKPYLLRGRLNDWYASRFMFDSAYFSLAEPISSTSFVLRARSAETQEDMLGKEMYDQVKLFPGLLEKQFDGIFCVDGMLHYNKELQEVVYVYYYRNQYVVMDTSLNLLYRGNTIDPISRAQIKADSFSSKETTTFAMSAPPLLVNRKSCVYGNWLLINSAIRSTTESEEVISKTSVVDVYNLKQKTYQFSFYIANNYGDQLDGLWLFDKKLYAMFENHVVCYNMHNKFRMKQ